jgi:hypothetical protein
MVLGEGRDGIEVCQRRHGPEPCLTHVPAAAPDGRAVGRAERMSGIMAGGASELTRAGEAPVEEQRLAERAEGGDLSSDLGPVEPGTSVGGRWLQVVGPGRRKRDQDRESGEAEA